MSRLISSLQYTVKQSLDSAHLSIKMEAKHRFVVNISVYLRLQSLQAEVSALQAWKTISMDRTMMQITNLLDMLGELLSARNNSGILVLPTKTCEIQGQGNYLLEPYFTACHKPC